jgi:transposase-like protein
MILFKYYCKVIFILYDFFISVTMADNGEPNQKKLRRSFTSAKKKEIIELARQLGNTREAARRYGINETVIRRWSAQERVIKTMNPNRRALRGGNARYPELECKLYEWVVKQRERELQVSVTQIRLQAQLIAKEMKVERFIASSQWADNFMKRKNFGVRRPTTKQQLPKQWEFQVAKFRSIITDLVKDLPDNQIGNFDEVSIQCDMPLDYTVDTKGATEVRIKTTGHEKKRFTVNLCVLKDGTKLPPFVILDRKTLPKICIPESKLIVAANGSGWMNHETLEIWLKKVWKNRNTLPPKTPWDQDPKVPSLLLFDMHRSHLVPNTLDKIKKESKVAIIPAGLTSKLQPLDLTVNRSFKSKLRKKWEDWIINEYENIKRTKSNNMKAADWDTIFEWIVSSWEEINISTILNGFRVSFGEDDVLETKGNETEVNRCRPSIVEIPEFANLLENFTVIEDENTDGFEECDVENLDVHVNK